MCVGILENFLKPYAHEKRMLSRKKSWTYKESIFNRKFPSAFLLLSFFFWKNNQDREKRIRKFI